MSTAACPAFESLLLDRAAGALPPDAAARLEQHLAGCTACVAEAALLDQALDLARLPPPSEAELRALDGLADSLVLATRTAARRRAWPLRAAAVLAVAAAAAAFLVAPAFSRRGPAVPAPAPAPAAPATWEGPDPATLWETAAAVDPETADASTDPILEASASWADLDDDAP